MLQTDNEFIFEDQHISSEEQLKAENERKILLRKIHLREINLDI